VFLLEKEFLNVEDLHVSFNTYQGEVKAVRGVSFKLQHGKTLALLGESGCGKSVTAQTLMKLNPMPPAKILKGKITIDGTDIIALKESQMRKLRGSLISMIFQDPMTCLNPTMKVGSQIVETLTSHKKMSRSEAQKKAVEIMEMVKITNAKNRFKEFPHQFSGGMRQRIMIAIALACSPKLLIADEPTTALDVTIQAQILRILNNIQKDLGTAIILITHDFGVVAEISDDVAIMYAGKIVEYGSCEQIFKKPSHPYTLGLLESIPKLEQDQKKRLFSIRGTPPDLYMPPKGCSFAARCNYSMKICVENDPLSFKVEDNHYSCCWLMHEEAKKLYKLKGGVTNA